jgi:hypothetical protein
MPEAIFIAIANVINLTLQRSAGAIAAITISVADWLRDFRA